MGNARKITRTWHRSAMLALDQTNLASSEILRLWKEGKRHGRRGEEAQKLAARHPNLSKAHWVHVWAYSKDRWYPEQNPVLALWKVEDTGFFNRQVEMLKTYPLGAKFYVFQSGTGELAESPSKAAAGFILDRLREQSYARRFFNVSPIPPRPKPVSPEDHLKELHAIFEKNKHSSTEGARKDLAWLAASPEIDLHLMTELFLLGKEDILRENPTAKLLALVTPDWREKAFELKKARDHVGLFELLKTSRLRGDMMIMDAEVAESLGLDSSDIAAALGPHPGDEESEGDEEEASSEDTLTPVTNSRTSLPRPRKK